MEDDERKGVELVARIKREAKEEVRVMRALRRSERVEAKLVAMVAWRQSKTLWRGGRRGRARHRVRQHRSTSNELVSVCRDIGRDYDVLLPALYAMCSEVIPASLFVDEISKIRSKRGFFFGADASTSSALFPTPALLVSVPGSISYKRCMWRVGACHIDRMCRHGYG